MSLELSQVQRLYKQPDGSVWICSLPEIARLKLGCSSGAVYLSSSSLRHILSKHPDISEFDVLLLPIAIEKGTLYIDPNNKRFFGSIYKLDETRIFFIPMKVAAQGHEVYVSSMHRLTDRQLSQKMKRLVQIK